MIVADEEVNSAVELTLAEVDVETGALVVLDSGALVNVDDNGQ